ncbi:MAG: PQQ-binding-like beta-propeller repeat protein [Planctomycetota bacterium]
MPPSTLTTDDLLFVSFGDKVLAVDRLDGSVVWKWKAPKSSGLVALLPSGDRLFVSINGYTWALDPTNGTELWFQPFKGEGIGIAMLATMRDGVSGAQTTAAAAVRASSDGGGD